MKSKAIITILVFSFLSFFSLSIGRSSLWAQATRDMSIASGSMGGVFYPTAVAIASLLNKKISNIKVTVQVTGGVAKNMDILSRQKADIAYASGLIAYYAAKNLEMFKDTDTTWLRGVTAIWPDVFQIIVTPDINSLKDLKGKRVAVGAVGSAIYSDTKLMYSALGMDLDKDLKTEHVSPSESAGLLRDKHISASFCPSGIPNATVIELLSSPDFKLLELSKEEIISIGLKEKLFTEFIIPANSYKNQPKDIRTVSIPNFICVRSDMEENLMYQITKTVFDNIEELRAAHKAFAGMKLEKSVEGMTIPIHPGAVRYYREKGVLK